MTRLYGISHDARQLAEARSFLSRHSAAMPIGVLLDVQAGIARRAEWLISEAVEMSAWRELQSSLDAARSAEQTVHPAAADRTVCPADRIDEAQSLLVQ